MKRHWRAGLTVLWILSAAAAFWHTGHLWFAAETPLHIGLDVTGSVFMVAGALLRLWSSIHIRRRKGKNLVTSGPYRYCRHPLYLGSALLMAGLCLISQYTLFALLSVVIWVPAYVLKMRFEESQLKARFGQEWCDYCARTARLLPRPASPRPSILTDKMSLLWRDALVEVPGILAFVVLAMILEYFEGAS